MSLNKSSINIISELNEKAWQYRYVDREKALELALEVKNESLKSKSLADYHFAQLTIAQLLFWKTSEAEHLKVATEALSFFEKEKNGAGEVRAHFVCAGMFDQYGQYEKAMFHALKAITAAEQIADEIAKADCFTLLGQIYSRIVDYANAIDVLIKGLTIRKKIKDEKAIASSLNLIARNYVLSKKYEEAKLYYEESLALRELIDDVDGLSWTYLGLASMYGEMKDWTNALGFYQKAEQTNKSKEKRLGLLCLMGKAKISLNKGDFSEAILLLSDALHQSVELKIVSLQSEIHQLLADAFEKAGDLTKALTHYKKYDVLKQELLSSEKVNMLKQQQIAFSIEAAEKEAEIYRLKNVELKNAFDKIEAQHVELEEKSKEITDSILYAKRIQDAYLPSLASFKKIFSNAFLLYEPKDIVSGDFYWYAQLPQSDSSVLFAAADCTGHGVPGAIMSVICCNALNEVVNKKNIHRPDNILNEVRDIVIAAFKKQGEVVQKDGMDISLTRLISKEGKMHLQFAGANNPLWIIKKGKPDIVSESTMVGNNHYLLEIKADKQPVGNHERMNAFTLHEMIVEQGDTIYSFSDGFADQFGGPHGKKFKAKPLKELLLSIQDKAMLEQEIILANAYKDWKKEYEQIDDMCMVGVRI